MGTVPGIGCNEGIFAEVQNPAVRRQKVADRKLKNRMIQPKEIILTATLASGGGIVQIFLEDAIQLGVILGLCGGSNTQTMTVSTITATVLRKYLFSYALVVSGYDFNCTDSTEMSKNLQFAESSIDQNFSADTNFSAESRNNYQNNPNLLNITSGFVWLPTTNLKMSTAANTSGSNVIYTFTIYIEAAVPLADLDAYLATRQ